MMTLVLILLLVLMLWVPKLREILFTLLGLILSLLIMVTLGYGLYYGFISLFGEQDWPFIIGFYLLVLFSLASIKQWKAKSKSF